MTEKLWTNVDNYINQTLLPTDPILDKALRTSDEAGLAQINVAPNQGKFLHFLAKMMGAKKILEVGTLGGYSSIWLARALTPGGKLVTLEIDPKAAEVARANIARAGLSQGVEVILGPASESLARLASENRGPFDLVFIDADKPSTPDYLSWSLKLSRVGTVIIVDNLVRKGELADASSTDPRVTGMRRSLEWIAKEPRLSATALQTVGVKGHDGFAMALVIA